MAPFSVPAPGGSPGRRRGRATPGTWDVPAGGGVSAGGRPRYAGPPSAMEPVPANPGRAPSDGDHERVELTIDGMHCASCAALIEEVLVQDLAVTSARVDLDAARASVELDPSVVSVADVCAAVAAAGYRATPVAADPGR